MVLFACSGIPVKRKGLVTRFLTSASLVRVFNDSKKHHDNLKVEVCHEDNVVIGFLGEYHLGCGIASVHVMALPDVDILFLRNVQCLPHRKVVSAGRDISGKLMTTSGILTGDSNGSAYPNEKLMSSTCKIPEASEGGPLFDFDGNFLGINLLLATEGTFFLPAHRVLDRLVGLTPLDVFVRFPALLKRSKPSSI
ncbi:uncharacterized protein LOC120645832 [Panicum virgatum]|uniref:uncharacterized protein LOC120645832 n=1 Tax=Panicum virgatum TaxID=38727 RepID=UPI0019D5529A|nr:uncharacterized protein LOC120645832 [Panicum virgatum]